MGKTSLLEAFIEMMPQRRNQPTIFFYPEVSAGIIGVEVFAESMFRSVLACPGPWSEGVRQLDDRFRRNLLALRQAEMPVVGAYSPRGTIAATDLKERAVAGDPRGHRLAELCLETVTETVKQLVAKTGSSWNDLTMVLCLDQFADYAPSVKRWIGSVLIRSFIRMEYLEIPKVLLIGEEALDSSGQSDYWEVPLGRVYELELKGINRSSCIKWLVDAQINPDVIDELMERTKGIPRRILELIDDKKAVARLEAEVKKGEEGNSFSVRQQRWLHAAAILEYVDREGLAILLGEKEAALAFGWLKQQVSGEGILLVDAGGQPQIFLTSNLRREITAECANRYPDRHQDFTTKISFQKRLLEKVPSLAHREYLRRLIPIEPFDLEMIDKIYGHHE
jgi:hypothetical protein